MTSRRNRSRLAAGLLSAAVLVPSAAVVAPGVGALHRTWTVGGNTSCPGCLNPQLVLASGTCDPCPGCTNGCGEPGQPPKDGE